MAREKSRKISFRVVATCLLWHLMDPPARFLIIKRAPMLKTYPNRWTIPGGNLQLEDYVCRPEGVSDDTWLNVLDTAVLREIGEEIGKQVVLERPLYMGNGGYIPEDGIPRVVIKFQARYLSGDIVLKLNEATEYKWITAKERHEYNILGSIPNEIRDLDLMLVR